MYTEDGCKKLYTALLIDAVRCLGSQDKHKREDALEWFSDESRDPPEKAGCVKFLWLVDAAEVFDIPLYLGELPNEKR